MPYANRHCPPFALARLATTLVLAVGLGPLALAQSSAAPANAGPSASKAPGRGEPVTLSFVNAEIEAVARAMASMTGRSVVVDPRVKGTMNLNTERAVAPAVAYNLFLATLRLQGYTVVEVGGLDKVVPEIDAKLQGGSVLTQAAASASGVLVTQIFKINFESANNLVPVLRPLISPNNIINVNPGNNSLVITDYADNLQRIARIIATLDVANATDAEVIALKHAIAGDLAPLVLRLLDSAPTLAPAGQSDTSFKTTVLAEPRSNTLIVRAANAARLALAKSLIDKLDQPAAGHSNGASGNIYVVYLKNADATKLAATLRAALSADSRSGAAPIAASPAASTPGTSGIGSGSTASNAATTGGQIQADPSTNALIITASEPQYRQLRAVIDKLDARRAQVFVESLIAEVSADKAAQFGVQWQNVLGSKGDNTVGVIGTNYSTNGSTNIVTLATQGASGKLAVSGGLNLALLKEVNGVYVLGALANLLQSSGDGNVLSTPQLLTLDNEEAKITIGQQVPFVTGQYTNTAGSGGVTNPFQTIERKDVGLTLRVKPQISENGTVKLAIYQEVSTLDASTKNALSGPTTNKRSIETNVLVEDGSIVVLGGLLQDEYSGNEDKVPGLGDVPVLGNLFKSQSRSRKKTNLMVFLRPVVVRDAAAVERLSVDRYEQIRAGQATMQPASSAVVPINESVQLPAPVPRSSTPSQVTPGPMLAPQK